MASHCANDNLLSELSTLPSLPGVYRYFDESGTLLYVGKARNLKKRVSSYFQKNHNETRVGHMVSKIYSMEITVVRSEVEALLLESNLIKKLNPKFNIVFRDDKSYPYLKIEYFNKNIQKLNQKNDVLYPRISYYRGGVDKNHQYFGPYPTAWAVKESIQLIQKIFQLRTCEDSIFKNRSRPCLLYQIKRCSAPCVQLISIDEYEENVKQAAKFLEGDIESIMGSLQKKMMDYSDCLYFEKAAEVRNQITALSKISHQQTMENVDDKDVDILAVSIQGGKACVNLAMVRGGRHLGDRAYYSSYIGNTWVESQDEESTEETMETYQSLNQLHHQKILEIFITQHYLQIKPPKVLICSAAISQELISTLELQTETRIQCVFHPREHRRVWLEMAQTNADLQLARLLADEGSQRSRTRALADVLDLSTEDLDLLKIECFDISHTAGEATQASCVVFENHQMQTAQYRRFKIEGVNAGDDYAAMKQALLRRYEKIAMALQETGQNQLEASRGRFPDLVLIDGGLGQIGVARDVFLSLNLDLSLLVGVEKGEGRKVGREELVFADGRSKLSLPQDSAALMLIAQIRDEAHRFAITGMRAQRAKVRMQSNKLEDITGVGPKRRSRLLQRFGGVKGVAEASVEELASVPSISFELAQVIYQTLRG